jgi:hypothetical protein
MLALHNAAADCGSMQDILSAHSAKVGWHILRIHRERNRIVHRANPSTNVSTLIVKRRTGGPLQGDTRHKSHLLFAWLAELVRCRSSSTP